MSSRRLGTHRVVPIFARQTLARPHAPAVRVGQPRVPAENRFAKHAKPLEVGPPEKGIDLGRFFAADRRVFQLVRR